MSEVNDFSDVDYGAVAKAYGAYGEKVRKAENVEGALRRALDSNKLLWLILPSIRRYMRQFLIMRGSKSDRCSR
jgi:thiamine pyrophosphate-dependent acetolactate synthase large subunit-like protein